MEAFNPPLLTESALPNRQDILKVEPDTHRELELRLRAQIEVLLERGQSFDLLDLMDRELLATRETLISKLGDRVYSTDRSYVEDPNPIAFNRYPSVDLSPSGYSSEISSQDLWKRSPYTLEQKRILQNSTVAFVGFGGIQECFLLLTRSGVGNFILIDPDRFESSNANRQSLCNSQSLGRLKIEVGAEVAHSINSEVKIVTHSRVCSVEDLSPLLARADIIIEASGDPKIRPALHAYARAEGKPVAFSAWAGFEGIYLCFMPEDPDFAEVMSYSPYSTGRGFAAEGVAFHDGLIARDVISILIGRPETAVCYPRVATFSMLRQNPLQIRDIRAIKENVLRHV